MRGYLMRFIDPPVFNDCESEFREEDLENANRDLKEIMSLLDELRIADSTAKKLELIKKMKKVYLFSLQSAVGIMNSKFYDKKKRS